MCYNGFWDELIDIRKSINPRADFSFLQIAGGGGYVLQRAKPLSARALRL